MPAVPSRPGPPASRARGAAAAVVVPVKGFAQAKMRLSAVLTSEERRSLARRMAERVVAAAQSLPVIVVCDDTEVSAWATGIGARPLLSPGLGLNGAVNAAFCQLGEEGWGRLVVAHADLPLASDLSCLAADDGITLVPDRRLDGTNVISVPTGCGFSFAYGPGSFARHQENARRTGLPWRVLHDADLAWDVDSPADMAAVAAI